MATENKDTANGAPEGAKPAEQTAPEPKPEEKKPEAKPEEKKPEAPKEGAADDKKEGGEEKKPEAKKPEPVELSEDDDDLPENADLLQLSKSALAKRLARHTKKEIRARFGTDNLDDIKAKLDKLDSIEAEQEKKRREQLTKEQKLEEDLQREKKAREKAEKAHQRVVEQQAYTQYETSASSAITAHFEPGFEKFAMRELKDHLLTLPDSDVPSDPKKAAKVFDEWAKKFVKENPKYAKAVTPAPPKEEEEKEEVKKPEPKKIALNTGANPQRPEKGDQGQAKKTARPNQTNTMSKAEYAAWKRERGLA